MVLSLFAFQDTTAILKKVEPAIYAVTTDDLAGMGFAIGEGKFLVTCDHVVGSESKITIQDPKGPARHGYLVFHDPKLDVAVYRMDRVSPASLTISSETVQVGKSAFIVSKSPDLDGPSIARVTLSEVKRDGVRADISIAGSVSTKYSGSPLLNEKGEVIGMTQASSSSGQTLSSALSGFNINQFLKTQSATSEPTKYVGKLGQVLETTRVVETPDLNSKTFFVASPNQYIVVDDYSRDYLKVIMPDGTEGYILAPMVRIVNPTLTTGTPGIANGNEIVRVVNTLDPSRLKASATNEEWMAESARFVNLVFTTAGREISDDPNVQIDIGREVKAVSDLQIGDRIYFGNAKVLRAAIYLGNGEYISVGKEGRLVRAKFDDAPEKPFYRALH